jgi:asparagine synthase (glutamine-hydrolysing)
MCGIAGIIHPSETALAGVPRAIDLLQHRGPDDVGYLNYRHGRVEGGREWRAPDASPEVVLLHQRLSILDLSESGWQPMSSRDGRYWMVFNGEIYNFVELREQLRALGRVFRSSSDSEVLLAAYEQWGRECLNRLVGMFALAILDTMRRSVFLARDFFGIKPLYYTFQDGSFAFASEVKALMEFAISNRNANPERLYLYLRHGMCDHGSETLLSQVHQLPAGYFMELSLDSSNAAPQPECYWRPQVGEILDISFEEAAVKLRDLFLNNIGLHLRSDVPVGAALSGGVDSSSIVMAMRHLEPNLEIHAFSYIAEDQKISEERWIDQIATAAGLHLHKVHPQAEDLLADLDPLTRAQDEPFGSTSLYAQYCVFRAAHSSGIKVMLDGQGADEILGGYRYYMAARLASLIRRGDWTNAARFLSRCSQWPGVSKWWLAARSSDYLLPAGLQEPLRWLIGKDLSPPWLRRAWFLSRGVELRSLNYSDSSDVLHAALEHTLMETSLPHLLRYEDRNSMAFSVESRVPFLTPELVNFLFSLPEDFLVADDGTSKAVFRRAMRGIVPDPILDRRDKIGFATPEREWLSNLDEWVSRVLGSDVANSIPFFNMDAIHSDWQSVREGRKPFDFRVWRWLNLIDWTERLQVQYN